ncbi:hypothetical protein [Desulfomicrobium baculatum]|uniref:Uncharacterized protein n=1 Tax=Desulfomicrobium baculatum (strain DSM 4028 / VKM B-1378 / X) TaxID=525897 RepID=C7LR63_DESBD|nr:hypothetical protein [Desulfomicrobium baculatum]ACU90469.1 hypothetical protein Dbac_2390 [Desulfomicrobium baculatum DSM 4028]
MRNFKAWWRTAVKKPEDHLEPRVSAVNPAPRAEPGAKDSKDGTTSLMSADPPTHTLQ